MTQIHTLKEKIKKLKKKKLTITAISIPILIVLVLGTTVFIKKSNSDEVITVANARVDNITQVVSVDGTVESDSKIDLRFQKVGKIETVEVNEGDLVKKGDVLMSLENKSANIEVSKSLATLNIARSNLNLKNAGPSNEDKKLSEIAIQEAEISLDNAKQKLKDIKLSGEEDLKTVELKLENAQIAYDNYLESGDISNSSAEQALESLYENADPAVSAALDVIRASISTVDPILSDYEHVLSRKDKTYLYASQRDLKYAKESLESIQSEYSSAKVDWDNKDVVEVLITNTLEGLDLVKSMLDNTFSALENTYSNSGFSDSDIDQLQSGISLQQASLVINLNNLQSINQKISDAKLGITSTGLSSDTTSITAKTALDDAKNNLEQTKIKNSIAENDAQMNIDVLQVKVDQAKAKYDKLIAKPRAVDIASLSAQVDQANATYAQAAKNLADNQILAPIDGVVTSINVDLGENVNTNEIAVVMIVDALNITANIPESDVTQVSAKDKVKIKLDAFPDYNDFIGKIISVNPAETVIQGVIYYEAKIAITEPKDKKDQALYQKIKSGMTADLEIVSDSKTEALVIPIEALHRENSETFVYVPSGPSYKKKIVSIGLEGKTIVEILEGLEVGDKVISSIK